MVSQLRRPSFHIYIPPLATALRGCFKPLNQCTVSIWWLIHCPGRPDENGQNRRYSKYFLGSNASYGRFNKYFFQSVSSCFSLPTNSGLRHLPGWFTFQVSSTILISPNLPDR